MRNPKGLKKNNDNGLRRRRKLGVTFRGRTDKT